ncbi:hypothetical protein ES703_16654 [subsurface metagenome]
MTIKHFTKNNIKYIKQTLDNGTVIIFPDQKFQTSGPDPVKPPLPDLNTTKKQLDFIISELNLKFKYEQ